MDGLLVQRIDPVSGIVLSTNEKQINNSLLLGDVDEASADTENEGESRSERKEREHLDKVRDEGEAFSRTCNLVTCSILPTTGW